MYTKHAEFKAGLVVILAVAAALALVYYAGGAEPIWGDYRYVHVRFEQGYVAPKVGDQAYMNGEAIGRISEVTLVEEVRGEGSDIPLTGADRLRLGIDSEQSGTLREVYVRAVLKMPADQVIPAGTRAQIEKNLTGIRTLSLLPGISLENLSDEQTRQTPIPAREAPSLADISGKVNELVEKVGGLVDSGGEVMIEAKSLLRTVREKVDAIDTAGLDEEVRGAVASLRRTLGSVEARIGTIADNLEAASKDVRRMGDTGAAAMESVEKDLADVMATLKEIAATINQIVRGAAPEIDSFLKDLNTTSRNLLALSKEFAGIGPQARRILADLGTDADLILKTLSDTAHNLQDASEDLRAHPWKLLNKPEPGEIAFENLRSAALSYMRAMRDLNEASARIMSLLGRKDLDRPEVKELLQRALDEFRAAQERYRRDEAHWQDVFQSTIRQR